MRAVELADANTVERGHGGDSEIASEALALSDEARPVHDDALPEVAPRRVRDVADPVAAATSRSPARKPPR